MESHLPACILVVEDEANLAAGIADNLEAEGYQVRVVAESLNRLELEVTTDRSGFVVVADTFDEGWSATVGGRPAEIYRTNGMTRGIAVPQGSHRVVLAYWPRGLTSGLVATLISLALVAGFLLASRVRQA